MHLCSRRSRSHGPLSVPFTSLGGMRRYRHLQEQQQQRLASLAPSNVARYGVAPAPLGPSLATFGYASAAEKAELFQSLRRCIPVAPQAIRVSALYQYFTCDDVVHRYEDIKAGPHLPFATAGPSSVAKCQYREEKCSPAIQAASNARKAYIKSHCRTFKSLLLSFLQTPHGKGVFLSCDMMLVTQAVSEAAAGAAFYQAYNMTTSIATTASNVAPAGGPTPNLEDFCLHHSCYRDMGVSVKDKAVRQRRIEFSKSLQFRPAKEAESLLEVYSLPPDDSWTPPPPPSLPGRQSPPLTAKGGEGANIDTVRMNTYSPQQISSLIPSYFVPMDTLLAQLPSGYTVAHVRHIFGQMNVVEMVELEGTYFIRFHGGSSGVAFDFHTAAGSTVTPGSGLPPATMTPSDALQAWMTSFEPDPVLLYGFQRCFTRPYQWLSLRMLVTQAPAALLQALHPLEGYRTLLYFAQMQHAVQFTPQGEGSICWASPPPRTLRRETTPTPRILQEVEDLLKRQKEAYVTDLEVDGTNLLSDDAKRTILLYYGSLRRFLYQHAAAFRLQLGGQATEHSTTPVADLVQDTAADAKSSGSSPRKQGGLGFGSCGPTAGYTPPSSFPSHKLDPALPPWVCAAELTVTTATRALRRESAVLSFDEKLEAALQNNNRRLAQRFRRRLAIEADPSSPYSDKQLLLDHILRYLPPRRHVSLRVLLASLPSTLSNFLPTAPLTLFRGNPLKVQLFEYRRRNHLCLLRPGLPLPDGCLRSDYTAEELLHIIAVELPGQRSRTSMDVFSRLPYGAREVIRRHHKHLVDLVEQYPQYFMVVYDTAERRKHQARITLVRQPPAPSSLSDTDWDAAGIPVTAEEMQAAEQAEQQLLAAEHPDLPMHRKG